MNRWKKRRSSFQEKIINRFEQNTMNKTNKKNGWSPQYCCSEIVQEGLQSNVMITRSTVSDLTYVFMKLNSAPVRMAGDSVLD